MGGQSGLGSGGRGGQSGSRGRSGGSSGIGRAQFEQPRFAGTGDEGKRPREKRKLSGRWARLVRLLELARCFRLKRKNEDAEEEE